MYFLWEFVKASIATMISSPPAAYTRLPSAAIAGLEPLPAPIGVSKAIDSPSTASLSIP